MTVLPTGTAGAPDERAAGRAMTALPVVGLVCGLLAAGVAHGVLALGGPELLGGALGVAAVVLLTRGMHVDALADTADALGSYAEPERAREIMHSGSVGPMGSAALALTLLVEAVALGALAGSGAWAAPVAALVLSRCLPVALLRRGVPAAPRSGFGALVAGSQSAPAVAAVGFVAAAAGACCALGAGWGAVAWWAPVLGAVLGITLYACTGALSGYVLRRIGGVTGDVLGASIELGCAASLTAAVLLT